MSGLLWLEEHHRMPSARTAEKSKAELLMNGWATKTLAQLVAEIVLSSDLALTRCERKREE
jgi:hypothetical protein